MDFAATSTANIEPVNSPKVSPQAQQFDDKGNPIVGVEQSFEYRDNDGNPIDPAAAESMKSAGIDFETRHEFKTRMVDDEGNDLPSHPQHPDTEGVNPNTAGVEKKDSQAEREANNKPANAGVGIDTKNEQRSDHGQAQPGSERDEPTKKN